jgi:hypothetical protein
MLPLAPPGPASPAGPPGMAPDAPSGPAVAVGQAVPSGFTQAGSAMASGAAEIIAAAAPASTADVREIFFSAMSRVYPPGRVSHSRIDTGTYDLIKSKWFGDDAHSAGQPG